MSEAQQRGGAISVETRTSAPGKKERRYCGRCTPVDCCYIGNRVCPTAKEPTCSNAFLDPANCSPTATASTASSDLGMPNPSSTASLMSSPSSPISTASAAAAQTATEASNHSSTGMSVDDTPGDTVSPAPEATSMTLKLALQTHGEAAVFSQWDSGDGFCDEFRSRTSGPLDLLGTEPAADATPLLSASNLPEQIVDLEYAVRGPVVNRAEEIASELQSNPGCKPFDKIIRANIGNPQAVGQLPITFNRQVLACLLAPSLLDAKGAGADQPLYPPDVIARARRYLASIPGIGAYSHSKGVLLFRQDIAGWMEKRDGFACDPESIMLTDGASSAIRLTLELLISKSSDGILIPVPQYPLYSASITRLRGTAIEYYLNEEDGWSLSIEELESALRGARDRGVEVRGMVLINPGNPTGAVMTLKNIESVVRFCKLHGLVLLADEVYQSNVYATDRSFVSARKVVLSSKSGVQLFSFHSASKGLWGECGLRGGLLQMENVSTEVQALLYKLFCVQLCSNTVGQALMTLLLTPPVCGDPSYSTFEAESNAILDALKRKAKLAEERLNSLPCICCQPIMGSMYVFPRIYLPRRACEDAAIQNVEPDYFYCMELLEQTGIVCVPGSGFSQFPGTHHFRITILPHEKLFIEMLDGITTFHLRFLETYSDPYEIHNVDGSSARKTVDDFNRSGN